MTARHPHQLTFLIIYARKTNTMCRQKAHPVEIKGLFRLQLTWLFLDSPVGLWFHVKIVWYLLMNNMLLIEIKQVAFIKLLRWNIFQNMRQAF